MKYKLRLWGGVLMFFFIKSVYSQNYQEFKDTNIGIIPPVGFIESSKFVGFQGIEGESSISFRKLYSPIEKLLNSFQSKETLASVGMVLIDHEKVKVDGVDGLLVKVRQFVAKKSYLKLILLFEKDNQSYLFNGVFLEENIEKELKIRKSLLSVNIGAEINLDKRLKFKIENEKSGFQLVKNLSGRAIYSRDGKIPTKSNDKACLTVLHAYYRDIIGNKDEFILSEFKIIHGKNGYEIESISDVLIDGMDGKLIKAFVVEKGKKTQLIYQVILFKKDLYYLFIAMCESNFDLNVNSFDEILYSFKENNGSGTKK